MNERPVDSSCWRKLAIRGFGVVPFVVGECLAEWALALTTPPGVKQAIPVGAPDEREPL
jgi:hypothetical protein